MSNITKDNQTNIKRPSSSLRPYHESNNETVKSVNQMRQSPIPGKINVVDKQKQSMSKYK